MSMADAAIQIFREAVHSVHADRIVQRIQLDSLLDRPLTAYRRIALVAIGKSALPWSTALYETLYAGGAAPDHAVAIVPHGYREAPPPLLLVPDKVEILEGGHPTPDAGSMRAAGRARSIAESLGEDDLMLLAVSGGGTSVCMDFQPGVTLDDARMTFDLLLRSGAAIEEMNLVRRHISRFHGGRFGLSCHPAEVLALVTSDVPGDDVTVIASGPVSPDDSTSADAWAVLLDRGLDNVVPESVRSILTGTSKNRIVEAPRSTDPRLSRTRSLLAATNGDALQAAARAAERLGYRPVVTAEPVTGEAREAAAQFMDEILEHPDHKPVCLIQGGETTVRVTGDGVGGRNQEFVVAAGLALERSGREDVLVLSAGSDGIDGPTHAAGGFITLEHMRRARSTGLAPESHLQRNDSLPFLRALDALVETGPTHVNVMDIQLALVGRARIED